MMSDTAKAIIAAAAVLGVAMYASAEPRYMIVEGSAPNGPGAYRLDRATGAMVYCFSTTCEPVTYAAN